MILRIREFSVKNLFGSFNYSVPVNKNRRITIIHAPNGYGKTTMLKLLEYILNFEVLKIMTVDFKEFRIDFEDGSVLEVTKNPDAESVTSIYENSNTNNMEIIFQAIRFKLSCSDGTVEEFSPRINLGVNDLAQLTELEIPVLRMVAPGLWFDQSSGESLDILKVMKDYGHLFSPKSIVGIGKRFLTSIKKETNIKYVGSDRLFNTSQYAGRGRALAPSASVILYSNELARSIRNCYRKYVSYSEELDNTFPCRLQDMITNLDVKETINPEETFNKLASVASKREKLVKAGIIEGREINIQKAGFKDVQVLKVLNLYISDSEKKLSAFDDVLPKMDLMMSIINSRFINKSMKVDKDNGFKFISGVGSELKPEMLSSGEQHLMVLLYELLFKTKQNSLVMIDEPEISLHIIWQQHFIEDILKVQETTGIDVVVATHSPDIIGDYWDLTVALGEGV